MKSVKDIMEEIEKEKLIDDIIMKSELLGESVEDMKKRIEQVVEDKLKESPP